MTEELSVQDEIFVLGNKLGKHIDKIASELSIPKEELLLLANRIVESLEKKEEPEKPREPLDVIIIRDEHGYISRVKEVSK